MQPRKPVRFIRLPEVKRMTGLARSTLYTLVKDGEFPAPVKIGERAIAWLESEIEQWAADRLADRVAKRRRT